MLMTGCRLLAIMLILFVVQPLSAFAADPVGEKEAERVASDNGDDGAAEPAEEEYAEEKPIADPLEPLNRVFFTFNDKLYFWLLKPVAQGYGAVVPEWGRLRVRNVFKNAATPVRLVNSLLQFKVHAAAKELGRFLVNTIGGLGGMFDILEDNPDAQPSNEDLGQTLGSYGIGEGFYIVWPVLGPSSLRDSVGSVGDHFLEPVSYITPIWDSLAVRTGDRVNDTSLRIGDYEDFKESALDPYISMRDAYKEHRRSKISE
jgi:phospholipid-binding lipoprotein MlaA